MTEYSRMARGVFTSTGAAQVIYLPFEPNVIEITNFTAAGTPAQNGVPFLLGMSPWAMAAELFKHLTLLPF